MGFSRQEHWSGLPCPPPGDLPDPGIKPESLMSPALAGGCFTTNTTWEVWGLRLRCGYQKPSLDYINNAEVTHTTILQLQIVEQKYFLYSSLEFLLRSCYYSPFYNFLGSVVKNPPTNSEDTDLISRSGRSLEKEWQPTPVFLPGKSHGQRSLAGYSPWSHKESDTTERLNNACII